MNKNNKMYTMFIDTITETDKAICIIDPDDPECKIWLPKSQLIYDNDFAPGTEICIELPEWLALDKGLI